MGETDDEEDIEDLIASLPENNAWHVTEAGMDFVIIPREPSFASLPSAQKDAELKEARAEARSRFGINADAAFVWISPEGRPGSASEGPKWAGLLHNNVFFDYNAAVSNLNIHLTW